MAVDLVEGAEATKAEIEAAMADGELHVHS